MKRMNIITILNLVIVIVSVSIPPVTYATWNKYSSQALIQTSQQSFDSQIVASPSIIYDGNIFKMWYEGNDGSTWRIGYATSTDGVNWSKYNSVVVDGLSDQQNHNAHDPRVIFKNNKYEMWYAASAEPIVNIHINSRSSLDGINWSSPLLDVIPATLSWEKNYINTRISFPFVLFQDNDYKMWFASSGVKDNIDDWRIGYANSNDGITWNKYSDPVLEGSVGWDNHSAGSPFVLYENGTYHLWYHAVNSIGHAISLDGIHWAKDPNNPVLTPSFGQNAFDNNAVGYPCVLKIGSIYYMWYTGVDTSGHWGIGLATSDTIMTSITPPPISPTDTPTPTPTVTPTSTPTLTPTQTQTPTLTPSPTPIPNLFSPIIIVPGTTTSWNPIEALACNLNISGSWQVPTKIVTIYNRLMQTLTNAGLQKNKDFYLYGYDWRQPMDKQGQMFNTYLTSILKDKPQGTKVRIIAHSMGGLVIQSYLDQNPNSNTIQSILAAGTPHKGAAGAYYTWEAGAIYSNDLIYRAFMSSIINHCRNILFSPNLEKTPKMAVQAFVPSIQSLLPTYTYLQKGSSLINYLSMVEKNGWRILHPFPSIHWGIPYETFSGNNKATIRYINVVDRTKNDIKNGNWVDGRPTYLIPAMAGDSTVIHDSSSIPGITDTIIDATHEHLLSDTKSITSILQYLQLGGSPAPAVATQETTSTSALMISTDLPSEITVTSPKGIKQQATSESVVFYDPEKGGYNVVITPAQSGNGTIYVLSTDKNTEAIDSSKTVQFKKGSSTEFFIPYNPSATIPLSIIQQ